MRNYRKISNGLTPEALQLKKRITRNRKGAIANGVLYLLGVIVLAVGALILPIAKDGKSFMGILFVSEVINEALAALGDNKIADYVTNNIKEIAKLGFYLIILVFVLLNIIRAFMKKNWLFKKTANEAYGFNRNVYAMLDLGHIFSGSLTVLTINGFMISLISGTTEISLFVYVGLAIHFLCGLCGMTRSFFDVIDGQLIEQKRVVGKFVPLFRNALQVVAIIVMMNTMLTLSYQDLGGAMLILPFWFVLVKHALAITEYNIDGVEGDGMKVFRKFSLWVVIFGIIGVVLNILPDLMEFITPMLEQNALDIAKVINKVVELITAETQMAILTSIVAVALGMFFFELIMRKRPKYPKDRTPIEKIDRDEEGEVSINSFSATYGDNVTESKQDQSQKNLTKISKKEEKARKKREKELRKKHGKHVEVLETTTEKVTADDGSSVEKTTEVLAATTTSAMVGAGAAMAPAAFTDVTVSNSSDEFGYAPVRANGMPMNAPYIIQSAPQIIPIPYPVPYCAPQQPVYPQPQQPQTNIPMPVNNMTMNNSAMMPMLAGMAMMPVLNGIGNAMNAKSMMPANTMLPSEMLQNSAMASKKKPSSVALMEEAELRKPSKADKKAWEMMKKAPVVSPIVEPEMDDFEAELMEVVKVDVDCPFCNKKLRVNSASQFNRCPSCNKIFQLRKSEVDM